ncbi:RNA polymerase I CORE element sequence-specific DNA Hypothetical protein [Nesidiocoris tenuis]|uniref:TATA box-binding protein-associated factor RNA polymerase I subunit B n=1 Tax=Nesidiocoris tenuis TaxID=355587 RepID=A0ABN7AR35_9HEMI|nr:RNA polymerase I CORE element sequence-specific DNA Hypothetical protein [Nesidiocoris tenuis]
MSQKIECQQCGSSDYRLESGFYFCAECHMQSQDVREQLMEQYGAGASLYKVTGWKQPRSEPGTSAAKQPETDREESKLLSTWESYNYILNGLVDELARHGAPKTLKRVVLQLWVAYLSKIEVAFTSTTLSKKPKLGLNHREVDAELFYKGCKSLRYQVNKARKARSASTRSSTSGGLSVIAKKRRLGTGKKRLARAEYNESLGGSSFDTTSFCSSSMVSFTSGEDDRIHHSKTAKTELKGLDSSVLMTGLVEINKSKKHQPQVLTLTRVLGILRIALLLCRSDVQIGEILRLSRDGRLSLFNVEKYIPDGAVCPTIIKRRHTSIESIVTTSHRLVSYLAVSPDEITTISNMLRLVKRYCKLLHFPDCIVHGVKALMKMKPPKQKFDAHLDHEGLAMALILFALKVLIGLDDFTEYNYVPRENDKGVVWEQWCHQYLNQTSMNNPKHYTALRRLCPKHPGQESDLSQPNPETFGKLKNRETNLNNLRSAMKAVLQKYVTKVPEDKQKSDSRPVVLRKLAVLGARTGPQKLKKVVELVPVVDDSQSTTKKKSLQKVVRLLSDDDETSASEIGSAPSSRRKAKRKKALTFLKSSDVWLYHNRDIVPGFDRSTFQYEVAAAEVLPTSFHWLLCELANAICQSPIRIYTNLVRVEKVFLTTKKGNIRCSNAPLAAAPLPRDSSEGMGGLGGGRCV